MKKMKERMAVTGYVPDDVAKTLVKGEIGTIDVFPERGYRDVVARLQKIDVEEVRVGSSIKGETLVQLILNDNATVETVVKTQANAAGLQRFYDPNLNRLRQAATAKMILGS